MPDTPVDFYFDFISPYAYLGWTQIHALAERHGRSVRARPILFAALLNAHGHKGPAEIPPKREYIFKNVLRIAHRLGVKLEPPPSHPFNPLLALRVASLPMTPAEQRRLIDALFAATWGGGGGSSGAAEVTAAANRAGLDGAHLVREAGQLEAKERLRLHTEEALGLGIFGVPTVIADGELFWGYDAFPDVENKLAGRDPIDPTLVQRWSKLPASARRT
jgi:2-hydroxychromene-2-carboxylate isomerase